MSDNEDRLSPLFVKSVGKAFDVLAKFTRDDPSQTLMQIAALNGMDKSMAQRFSHTLEKLGFLEKDGRTRSYRLTSRVLELAYHFLQASPLVGAALPYLQHLHRETGETINLSVLEDRDIRFILRLPGSHILSTDIVTGSRLPAYCTASGLVMLADLDPEEAETRLRASELKAFTPNTVVEITSLLAMLSRVRRDGCAVVASGYFSDDISVAVPLHTRSDHQKAAISIGVSATRFTETQARETFLPLLRAVQRAIGTGS